MSKNTPELEIRSLQELRGITDEGVFEGYIAVWDSVDDYGSTFQKGAFSKTIKERGSRVKVFYNHDELVGRSLDIVEDDYGVRVTGQLTLDVQKAKDVYAFIRDKTLDGLSFGFRTIKERFNKGVREILEVRLYEYGPVIFPANEAAIITDYRAERILSMSNKPAAPNDSKRSEDFNETAARSELMGRGARLQRNLDETLSDIWWSPELAPEDTAASVDKAISDFHAAYLEWANEFIESFWMGDSESRAAPGANDLAVAMSDWMGGETIAEIAANTSFTADELRALRQGRMINHREKLSELPDAVREAHKSVREKAVETLFSELRAGLTPAEKRRVNALLQPAESRKQSEPAEGQAICDYLADFRESLGDNPHA